MKEIGEKLKQARENMGITIEEAAEDLKIELSQIKDIEEGNMDAFKDVYYLKYFIRDYSKYLGLNKEDLVNEFNEYLFDYTSKISLEDIRKAKKELKKEEEDKIKSPYTIERKKNFFIPSFIIYSVLIFILVIVTYFVFVRINQKDPKQDNTIKATETKGE